MGSFDDIFAEAPGQVGPESAASGQAASGEAASGLAAPDIAASGLAASGEAAPRQVEAGKAGFASSGRGGGGQVASHEVDVRAFDVVLLPSYSQVEDWRKRHAREGGAGLFAQTVTTFDAWIADLWELHGDGRSIVGALERQTIMHAAFGLGGNQDEPDSPFIQLDEGAECGGQEPRDGALAKEPAALAGIVDLAAKLVRDVAGVPEFEAAVACACKSGAGDVEPWDLGAAAAVEDARAEDGAHAPVALSPREVDLLRAIGRYYRMLEAVGLVEAGQAALSLARMSTRVFPRPVRVLLDEAAPPNWIEQAFFHVCDRIDWEVRMAPGGEGSDVLPGSAQLRFGFPSGRYAQAALVMDIVRGAVAQAAHGGTCDYAAVIACADPLGLYSQVEGALLEAGACPCVRGSLPFAATDFGSRFLSLARVVQNRDWYKEDLSDSLRPPYSGFSGAQARDYDKQLRADRIADRDEWLSALRALSDTFSQLEELTADPEADVLLGVFEQIAFNAASRGDSWRAEQLGAASALRTCMSAARRVGANMPSCVRVLENASIRVALAAQAGQPEDAPRVLVTSFSDAAQLAQGQASHVVLCDLTSQDWPVADKDDAQATLLGKLGIGPYDSSLARARRSFKALADLGQSQLACLRPLNDWDGNPTYPAAVLQDLIDAIRQSDDDFDEDYYLPARYLDSALQRGEEDLYANMTAHDAGASQPFAGEVEQEGFGYVAQGQLPKVALDRTWKAGGAVHAGFCPSPSQIEAYLECPYKWFAERRLKAEGLDEGFGALERGSFCHSVLQEFYRSFMERGFSKVGPANIEQARALMREVAGEVARAQFQMEPGSGRYVPASQIEQREVDACIEQLVSYLDYEAKLLPTFHPAYLEFEITPDAGCMYASHPFMGTVDRIDVDDRGNAVVIDYKGSVGPSHEIAGKDAQVAGKVQTRMYAQAVRRLLGLNVVAAIYVSYGKKQGCAGAYDGAVLDAAHLPGMRHERCRCAVAPRDGEGAFAGDVIGACTGAGERACAVGEYGGAACPSPGERADSGSVPGQDGEQDRGFAGVPFADMLDQTESLVLQAISRMESGDVAPSPANADACEYCIVTNCPKRGA